MDGSPITCPGRLVAGLHLLHVICHVAPAAVLLILLPYCRELHLQQQLSHVHHLTPAVTKCNIHCPAQAFEISCY